ncbi:MAG: histidine kinase [Bacteroidetes bacterium 43-16]|nr:MAG: histidine kinase [Bacteroidetes bacterium 43-16]
MKYYIGCSGFYYKEWKELFYPAGLSPKDWFKFYCRHFNTIEINSSFYRKPSAASLQKWYMESPPEFLFSMKAPRLITHLKRFDIEKDEIRAFYELLLSGLQEKLGTVLFQLPPSFTYTPERLDLICAQLDDRLNNVLEFRHISWWQQEVYDRLSHHKIIFCGQSYPGNIPEVAVQNHELVYYRFHGKPVLYKSAYEPEFLQRVLEEIGNEGQAAFIYFNNTWGNAALRNSREMQQLVEGR